MEWARKVLREEMVVRNIVDWMRWGLGIEGKQSGGNNSRGGCHLTKWMSDSYVHTNSLRLYESQGI